MKNIVYLHGLSSSGNSRTGNQLRQLFPDVNVITPDIPVYPSEALPKLRDILSELDPKETVVVGTSMGGMYCQQMAGFRRILVNPGFHVSVHLKESLGKCLPFFSPRQDGQSEFEVTERLVSEFEEMEKHQFDNAGGDVTALFGTRDNVVNCKEEYLKHYSEYQMFEGEHRLSAENVEQTIAPLIREKLDLMVEDDDAEINDAWNAFDNPMQLHRLWKEKNNLQAALFYAQKFHYGDEANGIFISPDKAREIYDEIGEAYEDWDYDETESAANNIVKYTLSGNSGDISAIKSIFDNLVPKFAIPDGEKTNLPVGILINVLVGSPYYEGMITEIDTSMRNEIRFSAELEKPYALSCAFEEAFPNLRVEMTEQ